MTTTTNLDRLENYQTRRYRPAFIMEQVAGHVTHYRNLRTIVAQDAEMQPSWNEISYNQPGGLPERLHARLAFLPYYPFGLWRAGSSLYQALQRRGDYDAIYINSRLGVFFKHYFRRIPTIFDTDVTPLQLDKLEGYAGKEQIKPIASFKYKLFRDFVHSTRLVIAWSEWARQSFINDYGLPPERVVVNPPGVKLDYWQPNYSARPSDGVTRLLFVGGDFRRKGGPSLFDWFVRQNNPNCELHIVTKEPVAAHPGITVYHNMQPNTPELLRLYQSSDIFVLPSNGECFGIATIEAMACGLPVIQTAVGGVGDIIDENVNGYIIAPKNATALNDALQNLLSAPAKRTQMGQAGRAKVEKAFDVAKNVRRTIEYIKQVVE